jgi:MscS family membrane protein
MQHTVHQDLLTFFVHNQWLVDAGLIFVSMLFFHWISRHAYRFLLEKLDNGRHIWSASFVKAVHIPWLAFFWVVAISLIFPIFMRHFHVELKHMGFIHTATSLCFIAAFYWSFLNFITKFEMDIAPRWQRRAVRDKTTIRALSQLFRIILTVLVVLMVLPILGFETSSLLAFGGVGALGITYAAKDTLANVLGGMMIFWDRPFSVGDWIRSPDRDIEGTVEHIGWRLTRIRTFSKRPLYIPNGIFSTIAIENPARMSHRFINVTIGVRYDDAHVVEVITKDIEAMLRQHPGIDPMQNIMVSLMECASSSLNLNLYAYTKTTDSARFRQVLQEVFLKSLAIIASHGAECAFPTTTVLLPNSEDKNV